MICKLLFEFVSKEHHAENLVCRFLKINYPCFFYNTKKGTEINQRLLKLLKLCYSATASTFPIK